MTAAATHREPSVEDVIRGLELAWNEHDMAAFSALFSPDAHFVNVLGMWWKGRDEIQEQHERLHQSIFRASQLHLDEPTVRVLSEEVAVAHVRWTMTGHVDFDGSTGGTRRGVWSNVLQLSDGRWSIAASQNTDTVDMP